MSQFALLDENLIVRQVIVAEQEFIDSGAMGNPAQWVPDLPEGAAGIGYVYDLATGEFRQPPPQPLDLVRVAAVQLQVADWEVTGIERSEGIGGAFIADTDTAWVYFAEAQPDTNYILMPADGFTKFTDHVEVTRPGLSELSFLVFRVQ